MFPDISNFLNFDGKHSGSYGLVGICEKCVDSSFLIHHFLSFLLKEAPVCLLSFSQSFNHFNTVGNKIGNSLTAAIKRKQFTFIDGLKILGPGIISMGVGENNLIDKAGKLTCKQVLQSIIGYLEPLKETSVKPPCLVIDNISVLIEFGCPVKDVIILVHYLRSFCLTNLNSSVMVLGVQDDLGEEDEENHQLWKSIQHCSSLSIIVSGLDTGFCKEVHGQITARWQNTALREKTKEKKTQFKLTDKTCALFASGMSSAVL